MHLHAFVCNVCSACDMKDVFCFVFQRKEDKAVEKLNNSTLKNESHLRFQEESVAYEGDEEDLAEKTHKRKTLHKKTLKTL